MTTLTVTLIVGLLLNAIILPLAAKRVWFLYRLISHGQPAPDRIENITKRTASAIGGQLREVLGQRRLLKWTIPGIAHSFVMYAFLILGTVYVEAYGALISRNPDWHFLIIGTWGPLGFAQDLIAVLCLVGLVIFYLIRMRNQPEKLGRQSRFSGSHLGGAYLVLFMIFNVIWTMFLFRGAVAARVIEEGTDEGYGKAAFASYLLGKVLPDSTFLIGLGLILHIGVMLVFLIDVLHSKHLHIFVAPLNVMFKRPDAAAKGENKSSVALGAVKPMMNEGKPVTLDDVDDLDEDATLGIGNINDFSWKGVLDFASCTECGRCQSQCPAWNTEKPLSPKMLIMNLRDHAFAAAPYNLAAEDKRESIRRRRSWRRRSGRSSVRPRASPGSRRAARSSTPTCCGRARTVVPASTSARSTSSTSTTSPTCAATRCSSSRTSRPSSTDCSAASRTTATPGTCRRAAGWTGPRTCPSR